MKRADTDQPGRNNHGERLPGFLEHLTSPGGLVGPVAGMLLSDNGAVVIKVEPPGGDPCVPRSGRAAWLRGPRSAVLDLHRRGRPGHLLGPGPRRTWLRELLPRDDRAASASTPTRCWPRTPAWSTARSPATHPSGTPEPTRAYDALVAARLGLLHEQRGHLGGAIGHMYGEEPYLEDLPIPEGMEPGSPSFRAHLHLHAVAEHVRGLPGHRRDQRRPPRPVAHRSGSARGDLPTPSRPVDDRIEVAAGRAQRQPGYRTWIYDRGAPKGIFKCADGRWIQQWIPNRCFILSSADGDTLDFGATSTTSAMTPIGWGRRRRTSSSWPTITRTRSRQSPVSQRRLGPGGREGGVPLQPVRTPEEALRDPAHSPSPPSWTSTIPTTAPSASSASPTA